MPGRKNKPSRLRERITNYVYYMVWKYHPPSGIPVPLIGVPILYLIILSVSIAFPHFFEIQQIQQTGEVCFVNYAKLEAIAKEKGISKTHLCQLVGKKSYYLRDCKNDNTEPPEDTIKAWANALGTTVDYLTDKSEEKEKPTNTVSADDVRKLFRQLPREEKLKILKEFMETLGE